MGALSPTTKDRLAAQGFVGLEEDLLVRVAPWLRFSPALCTAFIVVGTALGSWKLLAGLALTALMGALFPAHPFDLIYNFGLRHLAGTPPLPRNRAPRRFACAMATAWLGGTAWAFYSGAHALGMALGGVLAAMALLVSLTDICVPSLLYGLLFGKPKTR